MTATTRRALLCAIAATPAVGVACAMSDAPKTAPSSRAGEAPHPTPPRALGSTGVAVEMFSLGGEGILRTHGREREAVPMILEALALGARYCDTAPAYSSSQDYYGLAFREAGKEAREKIYLASKTHARDRDGARALLDDSLRRLGTDHLDGWQLHDLRTQDDLDAIFSKGGAIEAVEQAKAQKLIRFVGITGHHDPAILVEAMTRYPFDTVLCAMNPADPRRAPFLSSVVPEARRRGMGVIGMKALAVGRLVRDGVASSDELIRYAASFADTVIVGCSSIDEVRRNIATARRGDRLSEGDCRALEARVAPRASAYDTFKA